MNPHVVVFSSSEAASTPASSPRPRAGALCASKLAVVPGGRFVVSGGSDRLVRLWDPTAGRCLREMSGHTDGITAVAAGPSRARDAGSAGAATGKRSGGTRRAHGVVV